MATQRGIGTLWLCGRLLRTLDVVLENNFVESRGGLGDSSQVRLGARQKALLRTVLKKLEPRAVKSND